MADRFDGGDESRAQALMAENERLNKYAEALSRDFNAAGAEIAELREALIAMDEAVCHGSPETAKRIAREAYECRRR